MASNIGAAISSFMQTEGKKILKQQAQDGLKQAASGLANVAVGGMGGGRRQQDQVRARTGFAVGGTLAASTLVGGAGLPAAAAYVGGKVAMGKAQQAATSVASFASKGATPEAGAALQGSVELAKNQINSFTNLFTAPGIKSIGDFFNVMADSPNQVMSFGEALLSVTGRLKEVSGTFAALAASRELRQLERDIKTGQQTGAAATRLNEAIENLKDEMLPIQNDLYSTTADLVTDLVPVVTEFYQEVAPWLKASLQILAEILRFLAGFLGPLLISMLTIFEYLLLGLMTLQGSWNPILNAIGDISGMVYTEVQKARRAIEDGLDDDSEEDPHRLAVQQLFNAAQSATKPPKPPTP
jgi:hypothetical protein